MCINKKADFMGSWVEILFIVLIFIGLFLAIFAANVFFSYIIISLSGLLFGRLFYEKRKSFLPPYYILAFGFLIGYVVGNYYANDFIIIGLFVMFVGVSYYLHLKKIVD
ncbi:MAG: hypothetical protein QXG86_01800 [Candidatus Woesearchaeota archaeon]